MKIILARVFIYMYLVLHGVTHQLFQWNFYSHNLTKYESVLIVIVAFTVYRVVAVSWLIRTAYVHAIAYRTCYGFRTYAIALIVYKYYIN